METDKLGGFVIEKKPMRTKVYKLIERVNHASNIIMASMPEGDKRNICRDELKLLIQDLNAL